MVQTTDFGFYCSSFNGSFEVEACESVNLSWERCLGPEGPGRRLSQAGKARTKVVSGGKA
jgi:hypothetical protein